MKVTGASTFEATTVAASLVFLPVCSYPGDSW
jgi:hypothetical protein